MLSLKSFGTFNLALTLTLFLARRHDFFQISIITRSSSRKSVQRASYQDLHVLHETNLHIRNAQFISPNPLTSHLAIRNLFNPGFDSPTTNDSSSSLAPILQFHSLFNHPSTSSLSQLLTQHSI